MEANHKKTLKAISLELRHLLEGHYDSDSKWQPGDLEQRLAAIGVRRDREPVPVDELAHLSGDDTNARTVVDAYLGLRDEAGVSRGEAVAEFVRETAYTWANRLLCLRCMEARELIDEVILQKEAYGGRSLEHYRLAQREPDLCTGEDDGMFAVLQKVFADQTGHLPLLFDPQAPGVALKPSPAALKRALGLLSGAEAVRNQEPAGSEVFQAPDALGWAYQYWNTEEKDRVFEKVRTQKGAKIAGADIIPATQLYTEPYMVKFLVQNSLGALWMGMHPDSKLCEKWEYYVRDADQAPVEKKAVAEITFLDPACGSGHFLLEAFDLLYEMYVEEGELSEPKDMCLSIIEQNLYGIDIDERAVQIAEVAVWMKAAERAFDFQGTPGHLVATNIRLSLAEDHVEQFLRKHPEDYPLRFALPTIFQGLGHAHQLGSLSKTEEIVGSELLAMKKTDPLFAASVAAEGWGDRVLGRLRKHFADEAVSADHTVAFFGRAADRSFALIDLLARRYDVVAANPPYMGSKNMGAVTKSYVDTNYKMGKRDLYACFILRCHSLAAANGAVAIVTQKGWLTQKHFAGLREEILEQRSLRIVANLGPGAFEEITGENVTVALSVFQKSTTDVPRQFHAVDCGLHASPAAKARGLMESRHYEPIPFEIIERLENSQILIGLPTRLIELLARDSLLRHQAEAEAGLWTGDDARFTRWHWEAPQRKYWRLLGKGGAYRRWWGLLRHSVRWENDGLPIKDLICRKFPYLKGNYEWVVKNEDSYFRPGAAYSFSAGASLGVRVWPAEAIFSELAPFIKARPEQSGVLAGVLSTRPYTLMLRAIADKMRLRADYVNELPAVPEQLIQSEVLKQGAALCVQVARNRAAHDLLEWDFDADAFLSDSRYDHDDRIADAMRLTVECEFENQVMEAFHIPLRAREVINETMGALPGSLPLVPGYDLLPEPPTWLPPLPDGIPDRLTQHARVAPEIDLLGNLRLRLRSFYEAGFGGQVEEVEANDSKVDGSENLGAQMPIPPETFLEELSRKLNVHPISVCRLLHEGLEQENWRSPKADREILVSQTSVLILGLLGHRWPKQIETESQLPIWADPDGIIPLTEGTDESTLLEQVRERIGAEFERNDASSIEREFEEIMGKPLEQWLCMEFFKHHTKQFKKRPIAWQIQSGKFTVRKKPAFACMVYYHKLDGDLLPKIRNQYVGPLRQRMETELRGIESVSADARSDRQESRRVELDAQIDELREFDAALQKVITEGFASKDLAKIVKDEPLDKWCSLDGTRLVPDNQDALLQQESGYFPDINDGVRVNIAPLQKAGLLAADVLSKKDVDKAIADRAQWRADERRWCRENKLPQPGWWPDNEALKQG